MSPRRWSSSSSASSSERMMMMMMMMVMLYEVVFMELPPRPRQWAMMMVMTTIDADAYGWRVLAGSTRTGRSSTRCSPSYQSGGSR
jgi:hypothetical protein